MVLGARATARPIARALMPPQLHRQDSPRVLRNPGDCRYSSLLSFLGNQGVLHFTLETALITLKNKGNITERITNTYIEKNKATVEVLIYVLPCKEVQIKAGADQFIGDSARYSVK